MTNTEIVTLVSACGIGALLSKIWAAYRPDKKDALTLDQELRKQQFEEAVKTREAAIVEAAALRSEAREEAAKLRAESGAIREEIRGDSAQLRIEANALRAEGIILRQEALKLRDKIDDLAERVRTLENDLHEANNKAMILVAEMAATKQENEKLRAEVLELMSHEGTAKKEEPKK